MISIMLLTALTSGLYGILHDQITYTLSPEYYTKLKFAQFAWADAGLGERWLVSTIGFVATSWLGLIGGWVLARRFVHGQRRAVAYRQTAEGLACILTTTAVGGCLGYAHGMWLGPGTDLSSWSWTIEQYGISDHWAFVRVAYIHNASYFGAALGLVAALLLIRPARQA